MAVYVDDVRHYCGRMIMCHMWADTLDELFAMADRIGINRKWIQGHPRLSHGKARKAGWVHFDVSLARKNRAIEYGAILTDRYGPIEHIARLDGDTATLARVAQWRARREDRLIVHREAAE